MKKFKKSLYSCFEKNNSLASYKIIYTYLYNMVFEIYVYMMGWLTALIDVISHVCPFLYFALGMLEVH